MVEPINQSDWDGVYYDDNVNQFFTIDVIDDGVKLINPFAEGRSEYLESDEFRDLVKDGTFTEVSESVVQDPSVLAGNFLNESFIAFINDEEIDYQYSPVNLRFAIKATSVSFDEQVPYTEM